jgi:iron complex transport system substrate-binding protein
MSKATWGDDDGDGVLPWVEDQLDELGAETPVLFDETDGIDFEAVADTEPDVILAAYSGLTQEDYDTLSKIAPVVAYPDVAWGTSYEDMIRLNSAAIGLAPEGDQLIEDLDAEVQTALADYPELAASNVLFSYIDPADFSQIGFYTSLDTRPGFLNSLGLPEPTIVADESAGTDLFYVTVSSEEADRFADVDVFVTYGDSDGAIVSQLQADPLLAQIPAIANGNIAVLENSTPLAASANPSPLSIGWGIDEYFALLAGALD